MSAPQPPPPRVLFVIPGEARGSSMVFARRQASALEKLGIPVRSFHLRSRTSPIVLWREFRRFRRALARLRPDVIHAHFGTVTGLFTVLASRRIPVVITYRGSDLNYVPTADGLRAQLGRLFSQLAALGAARTVCVSQALLRQLWWRHSRSLVLPSGVDLARFRPRPQAGARARLGWPEQTRIVVFNAGHDARNKRLDLAEAAFARLHELLPNLDLRLEVLQGSVPPSRMPTILNAADCLLLTSDAEGSPSILQEALASNLPVVSVPVGDTAERLRGVVNTCLCERDPEALAQAMAELLRTPCRSDGRRRTAVLSSARIARQLAHLYAQLCGRDAAASSSRGSDSAADSRWNTSLSSPSPRS